MKLVQGNYIAILLILTITFSFQSCKSYNENYAAEAQSPAPLHDGMKRLTDVIIHDIFSPPVAARNYAYPSIAAYEVARHMDKSYQSFEGQLNGLDQVPQPNAEQSYCYPLAAHAAFMKAGKNFIFSEDKLASIEQSILDDYKSINMPPDVYDRSVAYGNLVADHIIAWANEDNYKQSRSFPKFSINEEEGRWKPTPPAYMDGIEPHWREIRPMVIDSAQQFRPDLPTTYDLSKSSKFYEETMEVYDAVKNAGKEEIEIANFWDCNPYKLNVTGHIMHATKKITPGGHWIGIARIAAMDTKADYVKTAYTYAMTSIALFDGFISCWDEKYRSNLIRPETVINEHIDEEWLPILQTPPFPEYTSGHSVISAAAATALTDIYGDDFAFKDDTEIEFGLAARSFQSFNQASEEAAVSRLYGGIHYRPAIDNGITQGRKLGNFILDQINIKS